MIPERVKPRKQPLTGVKNKFYGDPELEPLQNLAAAIVVQAKQDAKRLDGREKAYLDNQWVTAKELVRFFESAWCSMLLGDTELEGRDIRKMVGI